MSQQHSQTIAVLFAAGFQGLLAVALALVGTVTGSAAVTCAAVMAAVMALHQATMLRTVARSPDGHDGDGAHFWSYGAGAMLLGVGAGAATVISIRGVMANEALVSVFPIYAVLGFAMLAYAGTLYVGADAYYADKKGLTLGEALAVTVRPVFAAAMVETAAALIAFSVAFFAVLFADRGGVVWMDGVAAIGIAAVLAGVASVFLLVLRSQLGARDVSPLLLKTLTLAVAQEAERIGAIKRIDDVSARFIGPGRVALSVALTFKDGVEAGHVRAVLDKLASGVRTQQPAVKDIALASVSDAA